MLANFLNLRPDYPIVVYGKKHDYGKVMKPAFERVGNLAKLPPEERWRDALDMAQRIPDLISYSLDEVLEQCGYERRDEDLNHDAVHDAWLCAQVYMKLIKMPDPKNPELGFCKK